MKFKSNYIYALLILLIVIFMRENLDLPTGDRGAYLVHWTRAWESTSLRNKVASTIFYNLQYFGEFIFALLYYRNAFKLSNLLINISPYNHLFNKQFVYYSILLSLFAPITLIFASFAGKDILGIFIASELCLEIVYYYRLNKDYQLYPTKVAKLIIYSVLLLILREVTFIFLFLLALNFMLVIKNKNFYTLNLCISVLVLFFLLVNWGFVYERVYDIFYYQVIGSTYGGDQGKTFSSTNSNFLIQNFLQYFYQMFTGVAVIHFSESFFKSLVILINNLITFIIPAGMGILYFSKSSKLDKLFFFKSLFLISFFIMNGFLSQNNPAGSIRYMSSTIPIFTTFAFVILPIKKTTHEKFKISS